MPKSREQKKEILESISRKIKDAKSIIFTKYSRLTVADSSILREELKKESSEFMIAPKTLANLALRENKIEGLDARKYEGQLGMVFGYEDAVAPAKIVDRFKKEHEGKIEFIGGIIEKKVVGAAEVNELAKLPSRLELYANLVGSLNAPISGFANALAGNLRNLLYVLKAIEEKK